MLILNDEYPLVSIVVPTKNRLDSLQRLLESIYKQDYANTEILIIDDGSDIPIRISNSKAQIFRNENSCGVSFARNRGGLELASGKFILFLDDDTELNSPLAISTAVAIAQKYDQSAIIGFKQLKPEGLYSNVQPTLSDSLCYTAYFYGYAFLARTEAYIKVGGFNPEFKWGCEELELSIRLHNAGYSICYAPSLTVFHYEDLRGRDLKRNQRLFTGNYILILLLHYPLWLGVPLIVKALYRHLLLTEFLGTDWMGIPPIINQILSTKDYILKYRSPLNFKLLKNIKSLKVYPIKLSQEE
jgi:GT2 family glycosyltransferase